MELLRPLLQATITNGAPPQSCNSASKKTLFASEQDRPDVARRRTLWKKIQLRLRSKAPCLHRRDMGEDQYDAHAWLEQARRGAHRQGAARSLENDDIPRRLAMRRNHGALRARRADQWRKLFGRCRAGSCADFEAWRHRRHGQSRLSQERGDQQSHSRHWRPAVLPAAIFARPQSDRTGLRKVQKTVAKSRGAHPRWRLAAHRYIARILLLNRMRKLLPKLRLRFSQKRKD